MSNESVPSEDFGDDTLTPEIQESIEAKIQSAARYVIPSDHLRPLMLQAARDFAADKRSDGRLIKMIWAVAICCCLMLSMMDRVNSWGNSLASPSAEDMNQRAIRIAAENNLGIGWGMQEAFCQLRQEQALRFGQSSGKKRSE